MEKLGKYQFRVLPNEQGFGWHYQIFTDDMLKLIAIATETFDTEGVARYAAIGHITLLERSSNNSLSEHF